jgi:integrase/recombinase XerD
MTSLKIVEPRPTPALVRLLDDYDASLRARGRSKKTIQYGYGYPLREVFLPFCAEQGITAPVELTQKALDRLATQLLERGGKKGPLSKTTIHSYLRAVNHFLAWARADVDVPSPTGKAHLPKLPRRLLDTLSRDEIKGIEQAADNERDQLIVRVLADTGIRLGELVALTISDLVEQQGRKHYLKVRGKGDMERLVAVPGLFMRLRRYADRVRPRDSGSKFLFLSRRRSAKTGAYEPLRESGVEQLIRDLGDKAGLTRRVYPHLFRHSFATEALRRGMNPIQLQNILGHASLAMISTTYSHLTPSDSHDAMEVFLRASD